jgi:alpha-tubulin suppressor-like RCC1 family protein
MMSPKGCITALVHELPQVGGANSPSSLVSMHMTHDCVFTLDTNCSMVSGGGCYSAKNSSSVELFLSSLRESIHFLRSMKKIIHLVSSGECMVCFGSRNAVWTFGMNMLGDCSPPAATADPASACTPVHIDLAPRLLLLTPPVHPTHMAVGLFHVLVVDDAGGAWAAGQGSSGELGGGQPVGFQSMLVRMSLPSPPDEEDFGSTEEEEERVEMRAVRVYAGAKTSVVVAERHICRRDGSGSGGGDAASGTQEAEECVYTFGSGAYFKLGHGQGDEDEAAPRCLLGLWSAGLRGVRAVACGRFHMVLLAEETRDVYVWGA